MSNELKLVDGSILEGGGQIIRMAVAVAAIDAVPINIVNIRGGRPRPGLAAQHLASLELVGEICGAQIIGGTLSSTSVEFRPGARAVCIPHEVRCKTAGAISLMIQASLLPLMFSHFQGNDQFFQVRLFGGTDVAFAPPIDFFVGHFRQLARSMGIDYDLLVERRGYFPRGGGSALLTVRRPVNKVLKPIVLDQRPEIHDINQIELQCVISGKDSQQTIKSINRIIGSMLPIERCKVYVTIDQTQNKFFCSISAIASTAPGTTPAPNHFGYFASVLVDSIADLDPNILQMMRSLMDEARLGATVDMHTSDQLVLPAVFASGTSVWYSRPSLHLDTALWVAANLTNATIRVTPIDEIIKIEIMGSNINLN